MGLPADTRTVAILLSTYNGSRYLDQQLQSFLAQTHVAWTLHWRDDGSSDDTVVQMEAFARGPGAGRCIQHPSGRLNVTQSFMTLLRVAQASPAECFAFADQDDVWLPDKLERGLAAIGPDSQEPVLYCSAHTAVDETLRPIGESPPVRRRPSFESALTQNIAQGCTIMLNRAAAARIANSEPPEGTWHDWWAYLVVTAGGGRVITDPAPTVLYRQHGANHTGVAGAEWRRALAAMRRGQEPFIRIMRNHVEALRRQPALLTESAQRSLDVIARGLNGSVPERIAALRLPGFVRQTWKETALLRLWFLLA